VAEGWWLRAIGVVEGLSFQRLLFVWRHCVVGDERCELIRSQGI